MSNTVRVKREGGRGFHLIDKAKYDANPGSFELADGTETAAAATDEAEETGDGFSVTHLGQGNWAIIDNEGTKVVEGLVRAQAKEFEKMDAEARAAFIAEKTTLD